MVVHTDPITGTLDYVLITEYTPNSDERDRIKRLGKARGHPSIVIPYACLMASRVIVRTQSAKPASARVEHFMWPMV